MKLLSLTALFAVVASAAIAAPTKPAQDFVQKRLTPTDLNQRFGERNFASAYAAPQRLALPSKADVITKLNDLWSEDINDANGPLCLQEAWYQRFLQAADGSYRGIFTTGEEETLTRVCVTKYNADMTAAWTATVNPGTLTLLDVAEVDTEGNTLVAGRLRQDFGTTVFVGKVDASGNVVGSYVFPELSYSVQVSCIASHNDGIAVLYTRQTNQGNYEIRYATFNSSVGFLNEGAYDEWEGETDMINATYLDGHFVGVKYANVDGEKPGFLVDVNLGTGGFTVTSGNYQNVSPTQGELAYVLNIDSADDPFKMEAYAVEEGKLVQKWSTTLTDTSMGWYLPVIITCSNGNVWFYLKTDDELSDLARVNGTTGELLNTYIANELCDEDYIISSIQTISESDGKIYIGGSLYTFESWFGCFDEELNREQYIETHFVDGYNYSYFRYSNVFDDNGSLIIGGFLRPNYILTNGCFPFFAKVDLANLEDESAYWSTVADCKPTVNTIVNATEMDAEGNAYVAYQAFKTNKLAKYDKDGTQLWCSTIPAQEGASPEISNMIIDGDKVLITTTDYLSYKYYYNIYCYTADGTQLWAQENFDAGLAKNDNLVDLWKRADDYMVVAYGYIDNQSTVALVSVALDGSETKVIGTHQYTGSTFFGAGEDAEGNIYAYATNLDENYIETPTIVKFGKDGNFEYESRLPGEQMLMPLSAETSDAGYTIMCGYTDAQAFFVIFDPEGDIVKDEIPEEYGYYQKLLVDGETAYITGAISGEDTVGMVLRSIDLASGEDNFYYNVSDEGQDMYGTEIVIANNKLNVLGHAQVYYLAAPIAVTVTKDGDILDASLGDIVDDFANGYYVNTAASNGNNFLSCTVHPITNGVVRAAIHRYEITEESGISVVNATPTAGVNKVYNIQGVEMNGKNLPSGVYIRVNNGKAEKFIVK